MSENIDPLIVNLEHAAMDLADLDPQRARTGDTYEIVERRYMEASRALIDEMKRLRAPIPQRIPCTGLIDKKDGTQRVCGVLHIDEGEFATKPHHTHSCQSCGHTWRPAIVCTVGVRFLPGVKNEPTP